MRRLKSTSCNNASRLTINKIFKTKSTMPKAEEGKENGAVTSLSVQAQAGLQQETRTLTGEKGSLITTLVRGST
jgi:hypothetical protein